MEVGEVSDMIVLAVEPKDIPKICAELSAVNKSEQKVYVSLAAGVTLESLESWLPKGARIARVMPNTPCVVGEMAAGYICNAGCSLAGKGTLKFLAAPLVGSVLGALGSALEVQEESDLDAVTGVSGSGPAYVFQFIEALSDGGVRMGLSRAVATELAAQCVRGAATMVLETGKHPGALKDEVTSPGGTTIAAVHALEMGGMRAAVMNAVVVSDASKKSNRRHFRTLRTFAIRCSAPGALFLIRSVPAACVHVTRPPQKSLASLAAQTWIVAEAAARSGVAQKSDSLKSRLMTQVSTHHTDIRYIKEGLCGM